MMKEHRNHLIMNRLKLVALCAGVLALTPLRSVLCQPLTIYNSQGGQTEDTNALTRFNIDFPGGTPAELVAAIHKSIHKPLNVIIPTEDAETQLPPLKMNDVSAPQLFTALEAASHKIVEVTTGQNNSPYGLPSYQQVITSYGFKTSDNPIKDSSIWYFRAEKPTLPPVVSTEKVCRFYTLAPYLDRGFSVDDITTAIQTGWKMSGVLAVPELKYHKETRLLIAFGEPDNLATIDSVLKTLPPSNATRNELDTLRADVDELRRKVKTAASTPPPPSPFRPAALPPEKPGK
jgi:hypothetical protein